MRQPKMNAGRSPAQHNRRHHDGPEDSGALGRRSTPSLARSVMQPLEHKMRQYDQLMQEAHRDAIDFDEEIRQLKERRTLMEERYHMAKAKHQYYEQQHQGVSRALRGESESPQRRPEPVHHNHLTRADTETYDDEKTRLRPETEPLENPARLEPSDSWTARQLFYVFVLDGIGGMLVSGAINFGLAYAMYTTQNTVLNPIRLFQLPNTLVGDGAVTIIIQCILTWFIEKALVARDLARRGVQPIGFIRKPTHPVLRWWFFLPQSGYYDVASDEEATHAEYEEAEAAAAAAAAPGFVNALASFAQEALRGFVIAVLCFSVVWPASVGILIPFGTPSDGDYMYPDRWTPQIFKAILGGVLGLITTPLMAMFWLVKAGWEARRHRDSFTYYKDG